MNNGEISVDEKLLEIPAKWRRSYFTNAHEVEFLHGISNLFGRIGLQLIYNGVIVLQDSLNDPYDGFL